MLGRDPCTAVKGAAANANQESDQTTLTMTSNEPAAKQIADQINGAEVRGSDRRAYRLIVTELTPVRPRAGWYHLVVAVDSNGETSRTSLMIGIVSGGGRGVMPWFEARIYPTLDFADRSTLDARAAGLEAAIIDLMGTLIPPGGHIMIEYESPGQSLTHRELLLRVPPLATHLGALMFHAGFRGAFKDWYISEGGHEGPRKLQANKSPTPRAAHLAKSEHIAELRAFIRHPLPGGRAEAEVIADAQKRARELLEELTRVRPRKRV